MISIFSKDNSKSLISSIRGGDYSPHLIIFSTIAASIGLLTSLSNSFNINRLASEPPVTLAQTLNGSIAVKEQHHLYRSPESISKFSGQTLSMLLNWSGKTMDEYGVVRADKGVAVGQQNKIPTLAYEAANAFTTDGRFREQVIERISKWSDSKIFQGQMQQRLEIGRIMIPQKLDREGHWRVNVVSTRVVIQGDRSEPVTFNRTLFIRAVPVIDNPLPEASTPEQKAYYKIRQHGLEIYAMQKFTREDIEL